MDKYAEVKRLVESGKKIEAVKYYCDNFQVDLLEGKTAVENLINTGFRQKLGNGPVGKERAGAEENVRQRGFAVYLVIFWIFFFLVIQVAAGKGRFWATLFSFSHNGAAVLQKMDSRMDFKFRRITVVMKGMDGTPDMAVLDEWSHPVYSMYHLRTALEGFEPGDRLTVKWVDAWFMGPYYLSIEGRTDILVKNFWLIDVVWILFSGLAVFGLLMSFPGFRKRVWKT